MARRHTSGTSRTRPNPRSLVLHAIIAFAACTLGCRNDVASIRVSQVAGADALWGCGAGFCARSPAGLTCWTTGPDVVASEGPKVVEGIEGVRDVALRSGEGCALHAKGVSCFRPGDSASRPMPFHNPVQVVATGGYPGLLCVLDATGVSCWGGDSQTPTLQPQLGNPKELFASTDGGVLCAIVDEGTRCFEVSMNGRLGAGIGVRGVGKVNGLMLSSVGGRVFLVDGTTMKFGRFTGTLRVGNPFATGSPLDVDVTVQPFNGATVTPEPIPELGEVRAMANWSIWPIVVDDKGIAQIDAHGGKFDIHRWPTDGTVENVWGGFKDVFYARVGGRLHVRGREDGKPFDRLVKDVAKPVRVVAGVYFTCALEEGGGVSCITSPGS